MRLDKAARALWGEQVLMIWVVGGGRVTKGGDASRSMTPDGHLTSADLTLNPKP